MTAWTIAATPNRPGITDDEEPGAMLDDGTGPAWFRKGWSAAWDYIGGNAEVGDTVTVLPDDVSNAEDEPPPLGWSPYYDPDVHGPLGPGCRIPPGWEFDTDERVWKRG